MTKPRIPQMDDIKVDIDFIMPAAFPDDGQTKYFMEQQFKRALGPYGSMTFDVSERDDGFNTITGRGSASVPAAKFDDLAIDLALVSIHWRRALLLVDGRTVLDGTQCVNGIPFIVIENLERYLVLTGRGRLL